MSESHSRVTRVLATAAVLTAAACAPERSPTVPVLPEDASLAAGGNGNGGNSAKVKIKRLRLASTTLTVDGPSVVATIDIGNPGLAIQSGVSIVAEVAQPAAFHEAANVPTTCEPGVEPGFLPTGNCTMTFDVTASSSSDGAGDFESGPAVLRVRILQDVDGSLTELASRTIDVSLVVVPPAGPSISSLTLVNTTLTIEGPGTSYTATLQNPGPPLQNLTLQGWIVQGESRYAAGGFVVLCGGFAVLPTGTCEVTSLAVVSNQHSGVGLLVPGPAVFELELLQTVGGNTVLDTETVQVELVAAGPPAITSITPNFAELMINGRTESASVAIDNPGPPQSTVRVTGWIVQPPFVRVMSHSENVECGGASGVLTSGACTTLASVRAVGQTGAPLGFVAGAATLEIELTVSDGTTETTLDTESIPITLVDPTPWIATSGLPSSITIGSDVGFAVIVTNTTDNTYTNNTLVVNVIQGGVTAEVGSAVVSCGGGPLPKGDCVVSPVTINVGSGFNSGAAKVELRLYTNSGSTLLDVKPYDVTLTAP